MPREVRAFLIGVSGSSLPRDPSASRTASNAPPLFRAKGNPALVTREVYVGKGTMSSRKLNVSIGKGIVPMAGKQESVVLVAIARGSLEIWAA